MDRQEFIYFFLMNHYTILFLHIKSHFNIELKEDSSEFAALDYSQNDKYHIKLLGLNKQ